MINLVEIATQAEILRKSVIGEPTWVKEKKVFEFPEKTIEVVVILKLFRAISGVQSQIILCKEGLFVDMSALFRCVLDCCEEIYFLLKDYPKKSKEVAQFINYFFANTIDDCAAVDVDYIPRKKIRNAYANFFADQEAAEKIKATSEKVYNTFCGYVHANYAHIMQSYEGTSQSFNLLGVPSANQKKMQMEIVIESYKSVLFSMFFICSKFKQDAIKAKVEKIIVSQFNF